LILKLENTGRWVMGSDLTSRDSEAKYCALLRSPTPICMNTTVSSLATGINSKHGIRFSLSWRQKIAFIPLHLSYIRMEK